MSGEAPTYEPHREGVECGDPEGFFPGHESTLESRAAGHRLWGMSHTGPGAFELLCTCNQSVKGVDAWQAIDRFTLHVVEATR